MTTPESPYFVVPVVLVKRVFWATKNVLCFCEALKVLYAELLRKDEGKDGKGVLRKSYIPGSSKRCNKLNYFRSFRPIRRQPDSILLD